MSDALIQPPADVVPVLPRDRTVVGMQLPIQSQSTIYAEAWEADAGPDELAVVARACEAAGFFYIGVCDHTFIPERLAGAMSTVWFDTVATLGWLAAVTTEIHLLSHIYVAALRHPLRAAKEFATIDALSKGRLIAGIGAGHVNEEFDLMAPEFSRRGPATDEAIASIALGLTEEFPVLAGPRWPASGMGLQPRPFRTPRPPLWVGGSSPAALRRTARFADGWLPQSLGPNVELLATLRQLRDELRDGAPLDIGAIAPPLYLGTPPAGHDLPPGTVQGTPEQLAASLQPFQEAGVNQIQVRFPSHSLEELCDQIAAFGADVLPLINS